MKIKLGSAFSGIGGFELGLHWSIPNLETVWQIEQNKFCQKVLKKHWPNSQIYDDITTINTKQLEDVDILCAGFPCQDLSYAGKGEGIHGKKSGLFWELWRVIRDFKHQGRQIPLLLLENVPAITIRGLGQVLGALSRIGYNAEWFVISAKDFGAPHLRKRWFLVAYPTGGAKKEFALDRTSQKGKAPHSNARRKSGFAYKKKSSFWETCEVSWGGNCISLPRNNWEKIPFESVLCPLGDGVPNRVARIRALGNAIVPQCSEWIGNRLIETGLLEDVLC